MVIGNYRQRVKFTLPSIIVGNESVDRADCARNLGVMFDTDMSMDKQISAVVKSVNFQLYNISKIRKYLTKPACERLINSFVTSRLDYNNALLYGSAKYQIHRLQVLQNTAARTISLTLKYDHITPVLESLHWLPIEYRIKYKVCLMVFKCLHESAPEYLCELLSKKQPGVRVLRSTATADNLLVIPKTSTNMGNKAFSVCGPVEWNQLPYHLRIETDLIQFKKQLKTYFFRMYFVK